MVPQGEVFQRACVFLSFFFLSFFFYTYNANSFHYVLLVFLSPSGFLGFLQESWLPPCIWHIPSICPFLLPFDFIPSTFLFPSSLLNHKAARVMQISVSASSLPRAGGRIWDSSQFKISVQEGLKMLWGGGGTGGLVLKLGLLSQHNLYMD